MSVAREFDRLIGERDKPTMIVVDNGTEFTSNAILLTWAGKGRGRMARYRTGQADAEWLHREIQWPPSRRVAQRDAVLLARLGKGA